MDISHVVAEAILSMRSDAIIAADREGVIHFWNSGAGRLFGYSPDEAISRSLDFIIPERLRQRHWNGYRRVMETGKSRYGESDGLSVPAVRKDGTIISVEFTVVPLQNAGRMTGMVAIMRDVTSRFNEMRALKLKLAELSSGPIRRHWLIRDCKTRGRNDGIPKELAEEIVGVSGLCNDRRVRYVAKVWTNWISPMLRTCSRITTAAKVAPFMPPQPS